MRGALALAALAWFLAAPALAADPLEEASGLLGQGAYAQAVPLFRKAVQAARAGQDPAAEARALAGLATALQALGQPAEAAEAWRECLAVQERLGATPLERAATLLSLSGAWLAAGRPDEAVEAADRATQLAQGSAEVGPEQEQGALLLAAAGHVQAERWSEALAAYDRALAAGPAEPASRAMVLLSRGAVLARLGDLRRGRRDLEEARTLFQEAGDPRSEVTALVFLARTLVDSGSRAGARAAVEDLVALQRAAAARQEPGARVGLAQALHWLATLDLEEGREADAGRRLEEARTLVGGPLAEASPDELAILEVVQEASGRWEEARAVRRELVSRSRKTGDPRVLERALRAQARTEYLAGHPAEARLAAEECARVARGIASSMGESDALFILAALDFIAGRRAQALAEVERSLQSLERVAGEVVEVGLRGTVVGGTMVDPTWDRYGLAVDLLFAEGRGPAAFEFAERGRARAFLDTLAALPVLERHGADTGEAGRLLREMAELRQKPPTPETTRQMDRLQDLYDAEMDRLAAADPEAASLRMVRVASPEQVRHDLDPDTALVEFFATEHPAGQPSGHLYAWALTRDSFVAEVLPGDATSLLAEVKAAREACATGAGPVKVPPGGGLAGVLDFLDRQARDRQRIVLVPHGALHYLPFAALESGGGWLGERWILSVAPSASVWRLLHARPPRREGILFAGALGSQVPEGDRGGLRAGLGPLPGTVDEVRRLERTVPGTRSKVEGEFTREAVRQGAPGSRYVHLATHGVLDPRFPRLSSLVLADVPLSLWDILYLPLSSTEVVVLSACDTALGPRSRGDEIVALHRAFLAAGARTVVASLWTVPDRSTADLMESFYRHLAAGADPAEALARAQAEMRSGRWPEPRHWAGWVVVGAPR